MTAVLWLLFLVGIVPLVVAVAWLAPARSPQPSAATLAGAALLCTLAFNLTFVWQEVWLVLAKAMTPGLHPILYHNNHDWTGTAPQVELLQGAGAVATLASGLAFLAQLGRMRTASGTWRLFVAWLAFEGIYQALSQIAIGTLLPGNDVGRAFAYLGLGAAAKRVALGGAVIGMAAAGLRLARDWPEVTTAPDARRDRGLVRQVALPAALAIVLLVPFRLPRDRVEVVLVPLVVHVIGVGWTLLGGAWRPTGARRDPVTAPRLVAPAVALLLLLALFRLVLARGVAF